MRQNEERPCCYCSCYYIQQAFLAFEGPSMDFKKTNERKASSLLQCKYLHQCISKTEQTSVVVVVFNNFLIFRKDVIIMPTEISRYQSNYESDNYNTSLLVVTSVQYNDSSSIGKIWNFAIPISFATFVTLTILLMCLAGKCYNGCLKRRRRDDMPVTTKYRVAMSNKLMLVSFCQRIYYLSIHFLSQRVSLILK